ncbi:glycosyltransferase family 4 protein [Athalassotoga saccharophila]|uniref:glycosyltransferase family 4 protein n=1 Tax=Athalassotoga saccharophila TaxID=1441386 RepID=UPI00137B0579|nr:glycosyltransferase family 4 protein [Athalassotoga saccharophila]BBJ28894.1 alpha-monoglucosyldiacylglycerol synthase [Athalassotoga saccharophila]
MNVGMMTDTYIPQINGVATSVHLFKNYLEGMGDKVYVFAPVVPNEEPNTFKVSGLKFFFEPQHRFAVPLSQKILKISSKINLDILHSHAPFSMGFQAIRLSEKIGIPHVHTYHTLLTEYRHYLPMPLRPTENAVKEFSMWFCNMVDAVIAPTQKIKEELEDYGVKVPIYTLPTGIDVKNFQRSLRYSIREKHGIPHDDKIVLFVGRIAKEKNIFFILEAFLELRKRIKNATLVLVGDGPEKIEIMHRANQLGIRDKIVFTGYLPRDEIIEYYRQSDIFAFASVTETQGLVVLEALAAGLPVVAVAKEGVGDVLVGGKGCFLVDEPVVKPFVDNMEKILKDDALRMRLSDEGLNYVNQYWSMDTMAVKLRGIYQETLSLTKKRRKEYGTESFFTYLHNLGIRLF